MKPDQPDRATHLAQLAATIAAGDHLKFGLDPAVLAQRAVAVALEIDKQALAIVHPDEVRS